jgi:hypothetical protein
MEMKNRITTAFEKCIDTFNSYSDTVILEGISFVRSLDGIVAMDRIRIVDRNWVDKPGILSSRIILIDDEWFGEVISRYENNEIKVSCRYKNM